MTTLPEDDADELWLASAREENRRRDERDASPTTDSRIAVSTFEDDLEREVRTWQPKSEPRLVGVIVDLTIVERETRSGDHPLHYPLLTVETDDGSRVEWHASTTVPRRRLAELRPKVGEKIGVLYRGSRLSANGREYEDFHIVVDRPKGQRRDIDWSLLDETAEATPSAESSRGGWRGHSGEAPPF